MFRQLIGLTAATALFVSTLRECNARPTQPNQNIEPIKALGSPLSFLESPYWEQLAQDGALPEQDVVQVYSKGGVRVHKLENGKYALTTDPFQISLRNSCNGILSGDLVNPNEGYTVFLDPDEVDSLQSLIFANGGVAYRATDGAFEQIEFNVPKGYSLGIFTFLDPDNRVVKSFGLFENYEYQQ